MLLEAALPITAGAQTPADSEAIRATALDYIEGWYTGHVARMELALHPHLAKRLMELRADGGEFKEPLEHALDFTQRLPRSFPLSLRDPSNPAASIPLLSARA